jgi:hypothetical protein
MPTTESERAKLAVEMRRIVSIAEGARLRGVSTEREPCATSLSG